MAAGGQGKGRAAGQKKEAGICAKAAAVRVCNSNRPGSVAEKNGTSKPENNANSTADTVTDTSAAGPDENEAADQSQNPPENESDEPLTTADDQGNSQTVVSYKKSENSIYQYQENTRTLGKGILSSHAVLVDPDQQTILACKAKTDCTCFHDESTDAADSRRTSG